MNSQHSWRIASREGLKWLGGGVATAIPWLMTPHCVNNNRTLAESSSLPAQPRDSPWVSSQSLPSPVSPIRIFRPNPYLEIAFDVRTRNPLYVLEQLRPKETTTTDKRGPRHRPNFYEQVQLPEYYRSRASHYKKSGYDRGHMAPAGDFADPQEIVDTFTLCNISPQVHSMNVTIWHQLEQWTRKIVSQQQSSPSTMVVYVVTGPLWLPHHQINATTFDYQYPAIGTPPSLVHVPTHFFKVIVVVDQAKEAIVQYACFVMGNQEYDGRNNKNASKRSLEDYLVSWTDLEIVSGLEFFPTYATREWKAIADQVFRDHISTHRHPVPRIEDGSSAPIRRLLLTNGTETLVSTTNKPTIASSRKRQPQPQRNMVDAMPLVQHLCSNGRCQ